MFKVEKGKTKTLDVLAKEFYSLLKPSNLKSSSRKYSIVNRLNKSISKETDTLKKRFYKHLKKKNYKLLKKIISSPSNQLVSIMNDFELMVLNKEIPAFHEPNGKTIKATKFGEEVLELFNYKACRGSVKFNWLVRELDIPVCPYCNEVYTFQVKRTNDEIILHDFDHFIPKVIAPYLSLSFYNLIPTCHSCNSPLKREKIFNLTDYIYPYHDDLNTLMKFSIDNSVIGNDLNTFNIIINELTTDTNEIKKITNHNEVFAIIPRYNNFKNEIIRLNQLKDTYNISYKNQLLDGSLLGVIFSSEQELKQNIETIFNIPSSNLSASRMSLGKFKKDIAEEFKILD
ncbi:MAG: hypothetical protein WCH34_05350 [Bacteroidota bacterium]